MAVTQDEILIRLGLDSSQLTKGTAATLDQEKKAAMDYTSFWKKAIEERSAAEIRANEQSLQRLKQFQAAQKSKSEAFFKEQARMYDEQAQIAAIGNGSIPEGWQKQIEERNARINETMRSGAGNAAGMGAMTLASGGSLKEAGESALAGAAGAVATRAAEKAAGHVAESRVFTELMVLIREGLRGNFTKMAGSFTILARACGATAATFISAIPIVGAAAAAFLGMKVEANKMDAAIKQSEASSAGFKKDEGKLQGRLGKIVSRLAENGQLTGPDGAEIQKRISTGGMDNLMVAQKLLRKMFPNGIPHNMPADSSELDERARTGMNPDQRWNDTTMRLMRAKAALQGLTPGSKPYKEQNSKVQKLLKQQAADSKAIAQWTASVRKHQEQQDSQDRVFPTLEQLSKANSPQGQMARFIQQLTGDQLHRRMFGDKIGANAEASEIGRLMGYLESQGALAPDSRLSQFRAALAGANGQHGSGGHGSAANQAPGSGESVGESIKASAHHLQRIEKHFQHGITIRSGD